nr:family 16 glycosylhydrolase [Lentzea nigeriaca]
MDPDAERLRCRRVRHHGERQRRQPRVGRAALRRLARRAVQREERHLEQSAVPGASCQGGFHPYLFEWDASTSPQQLRWYVDGELFHQVTRTSCPRTRGPR